MRLLRLHLPAFKNLREFTIEFDESASLSVLVGRNGTGKSNVVEALTVIFRDLDLGANTPFAYGIKYACRRHRVEIDHDPDGDTACRLDGVDASISAVQGERGRGLRPDHVFGYYSGPSNRLEEHFHQHQENFYRSLVRGVDRPLRPLFYARTVHSNFVLLAFFLEDDPAMRDFLSEQLGIVGLDSVLFVMQKPPWSSKQGDPRFWNARGTVEGLLDGMYALALAPLRRRVRVTIGLHRRVSTERLYLFLPDVSAARELAGRYRSNQEFFKALESTYISELMADVRIRVLVKRADAPLTFRELSEGEQQLLLVLGLMRFTKEEESLFLLDEPDTHLNPAWSVQYRQFLSTFGALDESCHVILATHDPLIVAGLTRSEVRILFRAEDEQIAVAEPTEDPRGMGVGALLTSDVYGLRSQLDLETLQLLDRKRALAAQPSLNDQDTRELEELNSHLAGIGLLAEDRDPEFQAFLQARQTLDERHTDDVSLTPSEVDQQRALTLAIVERLAENDQDS